MGKEAEAAGNGKTAGLGYLLNNLISLMGLFGMACFGLGLLIRVAMDVSGVSRGEGAYEGLVTYIVLPALFTASAAFTALGMFRKWRRTRQLGVAIGLLPERTRGRRIAAVVAAVAVTALWMLLSAFGTYRAYQYSDSNAFCGLACHQVMEPEYTAYRQSVHARVHCVECHIGPGADWFVKSKLTGMRQLWAMVRTSYKTPIATPLHSLRPAQDTCEQCHWPGRFSGSLERVITHYSADEANTPVRYCLLMKVGGGHSDLARPGGAHWHVSNDWTVRYLPLDEKRQNIPYVRVIYNDGRVAEFMAAGFDRTTVAESSLRTMDCLDCHTRPSHVFRSPDRALDAAMDKGLISASLPGVKRVAVKALAGEYKTKPEALAAIDAAFDAYAKAQSLSAAQQELLAKAREEVRRIYGVNFFPEHGVDYRAFIDNLGHFEQKGCERCHDGKHKSADNQKTITRECNNCHEIIGQANGATEVTQMQYKLCKFEHPDEPVNPKKLCSSCHGLEKEGK
ncbi:MAG: NapC/NirT family cytochrome c [Planctomycetota bacterium]|nr:NapC/NirT family cytochrome c [Planctomycetota bacterium]